MLRNPFKKKEPGTENTKPKTARVVIEWSEDRAGGGFAVDGVGGTDFKGAVWMANEFLRHQGVPLERQPYPQPSEEQSISPDAQRAEDMKELELAEDWLIKRDRTELESYNRMMAESASPSLPSSDEGHSR